MTGREEIYDASICSPISRLFKTKKYGIIHEQENDVLRRFQNHWCIRNANRENLRIIIVLIRLLTENRSVWRLLRAQLNQPVFMQIFHARKFFMSCLQLRGKGVLFGCKCVWRRRRRWVIYVLPWNAASRGMILGWISGTKKPRRNRASTQEHFWISMFDDLRARGRRGCRSC